MSLMRTNVPQTHVNTLEIAYKQTPGPELLATFASAREGMRARTAKLTLMSVRVHHVKTMLSAQTQWMPTSVAVH